MVRSAKRVSNYEACPSASSFETRPGPLLRMRGSATCERESENVNATSAPCRFELTSHGVGAIADFLEGAATLLHIGGRALLDAVGQFSRRLYLVIKRDTF